MREAPLATEPRVPDIPTDGYVFPVTSAERPKGVAHPVPMQAIQVLRHREEVHLMGKVTIFRIAAALSSLAALVAASGAGQKWG